MLGRSLILALCALAAVPAYAQTPGVKEEAQRLFREGQAAYRLGKYEEAIGFYERTYRLMQHPAFVFNIGQAYRKRWETEKKVELLRRALTAYRTVLRDDHDGALRADAEKFIAELTVAVKEEEQRERARLLETAAAGEELRIARKLLEEGAPADARVVLDRLCRRAGTPRDVLAQAYLLHGKVAIAQGDREGAITYFKRAIVLQPALEPADQGPVQAAYAAAREAVAGGRIAVTLWPLGEIKRGEPATVGIIIESDPLGMIDGHELLYRVAGRGGAFSSVKGKRGASLTVPAMLLGGLASGTRVEYFVRAVDTNGAVVAELGTENVPYVFTVRVPGGEAPPKWYGKWWVWTIAGAVVIGASASAGYFATRSSGSSMLTIHAPVVH
jgi:tetratricopeptide (TPR) repeat protein